MKDSDGKIISSKYYKVTYPKARKKAGTYTVKIKFSGKYKDTVTKKNRIKKKKNTVVHKKYGQRYF